jgi:hypothetical protein
MMWLSFCDPKRGKGYRFLGACIVPGNSVPLGARIANVLGCNPGGEVMGHLIPEDRIPLINAKWMNRLLNRAECAEMDREVLAAADALKLNPPQENPLETVCPDCHEKHVRGAHTGRG